MGVINWHPTCCAWHGEYAEAATKEGGIARLKRSPDRPGVLLVCRFGPDNVAMDADGDGVPDYVVMTEDEAGELLAGRPGQDQADR